MDEPFFSLALPILNGMPGLRRTIEAVQRQTYKNFELIVQDGGSTDGSLDYIRSVDLPKIDIVSEPDSGKGQAENRAYRRCRGPLIVLLACDEWLEDNALETFASWYREYPNAAFCYGGIRYQDSETNVHSTVSPGRFDLLKLLMMEFAPCRGGFFNRDVIGADFYADEEVKSQPIFELLMRLGLRFNELEIIERPAIAINTSVDRSNWCYSDEAYAARLSDMLSILEHFFAQQGNSPLTTYIHDVCVSSVYVEFARKLMALMGETLEVQNYIFKAAEYRPGSPKITELVRQCRGIISDETTGQIFRRHKVQPALPPSNAAEIEGVCEISHTKSEPESVADGAATTQEGSLARVKTSWPLWSVATQIPLSFGNEWSGGGWYWLELTLQVQSGRVGVSIRTAAGGVKGEQVISQGNRQRLTFAFNSSDRAVVIKNAFPTGASEVALLEARVLGMKMPASEDR